LIVKTGAVLEVEPYRFFIDESGETSNLQFGGGLDETVNLLVKLPDQLRLSVINRISANLRQDTE
jgi:hypothetical protein